MATVSVLRIVVASPSDVQAERNVLEEVANELNRGIAADRGLRLEVFRWETDMYPGFHREGPQGLIDPVLGIEDTDILVGIFWKRFGTPTKEAKSGTEHEIRAAYERWKNTDYPQIMVYFNGTPYAPKSKEETDQWGQVLQFKDDFPKEGLWWGYEGPDAFERLVRNHLTQHIRHRYTLSDSAREGGASAIRAEFAAEETVSSDGSLSTTPTDGVKVFISYAHGDMDEENLASALSLRLVDAGHQVFYDEKINAGTEWLNEIRRRIRWCDYLIVLLSATSMDSEMVLEEVRLARRNRRREGKPRIIPVRVGYQGPLEYELHKYLGHLQYVGLERKDDMEAVCGEILRAVRPTTADTEEPDFSARLRLDRIARDTDPVRPSAATDARILFVPGGNVRINDPYYVERAADAAAMALAVQPFGETLVIKGPRQIGKSSLLVRYLAACEDAGKMVAFVDFSRFSKSDLSHYPTFLSRLSVALQQRLHLEGDKEPVVNSQFDMVTFVENEILSKVAGPCVVAFDEVDRVYGCEYQADFFTMLRSWHNNRSLLGPRWESLDLALVISTEPYLLIDSADRSPFNVGLVLELNSFTYEEHADLCGRYDLQIDRDELWELLEGHPYLTRLAFYRLVGPNHMTFDELVDKADDERGPFGDHLRALLSKIQDAPDLLHAMKMVRYGERPADDLYYRLYGAGLVRANGKRVNPANLLYDQYLRRVL